MYAKIREFSFMLPGFIFKICTLLYSLPQVSSAHHRLLNCNLSVLGRVRNKTEKCTTGAQGLLQRLRAFNYKKSDRESQVKGRLWFAQNLVGRCWVIIWYRMGKLAQLNHNHLIFDKNRWTKNNQQLLTLINFFYMKISTGWCWQCDQML